MDKDEIKRALHEQKFVYCSTSDRSIPYGVCLVRNMYRFSQRPSVPLVIMDTGNHTYTKDKFNDLIEKMNGVAPLSKWRARELMEHEKSFFAED